MTIIESIQLFVAINLFVIGLSHFLQPRMWVEFFEYLVSKGNVGNIFNAMISVGMGSFILSFHLVWEFPAIIVTIYGLLQLLKGTVYLVLPSVGLESIKNVNKKSEKFKWVGIVMCMLSLLIIVGFLN